MTEPDDALHDPIDGEVDDDFDWDTWVGEQESEPLDTSPRWERPVWLPPSPEERELELAPVTCGGLGEFLRACRARAGLSQRMLAEAAGVAHTTLARLESGRVVDVHISTLVRLAAACDVMLVGATDESEPLVHTDRSQRHRDAADRFLPAHLFNQPADQPDSVGAWWGRGSPKVAARRGEPGRLVSARFRYRDLAPE